MGQVSIYIYMISNQYLLKAGTINVVKTGDAPPLFWPLGRIVKVYSRPDQIVRVAKNLTSQRVITILEIKLVPLPTDP